MFISLLMQMQTKQKTYLGRDLHSAQASDDSLFSLSQKGWFWSTASSTRPCSVKMCCLIVGSLTNQIIENDNVAIIAAGTQYCYSIVMPRVIENKLTMISSPNTNP